MTNSAILENLEERADHLRKDELESLSVEHTYFRAIRSKLFERGTKLLVGPRGTGKTHQMRLAYYESISDKTKPIAVYTTFNQYLRLEPLLHKTVDAKQIFHTWVLAKIIIACSSTLRDMEIDEVSILEKINLDQDMVEGFISQVESGIVPDNRDEAVREITIDTAKSAIECLIGQAGRTRAVLLLDDAALSLTPEYLIEFFNAFSTLKSSKISPKASVYPGTTQYGPRFHVRHDAEFISVWLDINDSNYSEIMQEVFDRRIGGGLSISQDLIDVLKYAAFGVPRVFLTMLREYESSKGKTPQQKLNRVLEQQTSFLYAEFRSIGLKLPQFQSLIDYGVTLQQNIIRTIADENKRTSEEAKKKTLIGILRDDDFRKPMAERLINFLQEVGLLYELTPVSHGEDREYERYIPHVALLIHSGAFRVSHGSSMQSVVKFIEQGAKQHPLRRNIKRLLEIDSLESLVLDLPRCQNCGEARLNEHQKFCHQCGSPLVNKSTFEECMLMPIEHLPLPEWQKEGIKGYTSIRNVSDLISIQDPASELRKVKKIGPKRSEKILQAAGKFVEEFLS